MGKRIGGFTSLTRSMPQTLKARKSAAPLTPNQVRGFWAAWGGIVLDGMDSFIYALVLVPAMRDLLPASGIPATPGNLGFYGSIMFAVFLIGWGCAFLWGPLADRFGRVRALILAILVYSAFTFLSCFARNMWELGICRLLAGLAWAGNLWGRPFLSPKNCRTNAA